MKKGVQVVLKGIRDSFFIISKHREDHAGLLLLCFFEMLKGLLQETDANLPRIFLLFF